MINNSLQYKFYTPTGDTGVGSGVHQTSAVVTYNNTGETKEYLPRFKTKYYLSQISQNSDGLILRGIGTVAYQKATYSPDNTKASFFLDNSSMTSKLDGRES